MSAANGQASAPTPQASAVRTQINTLRMNPKYKSLILPEQITPGNFPFLSEQQITQYGPGLMTFWQALIAKPETDTHHQAALQKLTTFSSNLVKQLGQYRSGTLTGFEGKGMAAAAGQNGNAGGNATQAAQAQAQAQQAQVQQQAQQQTQPQVQAQSAQQTAQPQQPQQTSQAAQALPPLEPQSELPSEIKQRIQNVQLDAPPHLQGQEAANWRNEAQKRYSAALMEQYKAKTTLVKADQAITSSRSQGKEVPQGVTDTRAAAEEVLRSSQKTLDQFNKQQAMNKQPAAQAAARVINNAQQMNGANGRPTSADQQQQQIPVNPAIAAAQQQMRTSMTPPTQQPQQQQVAPPLQNPFQPQQQQQQPMNNLQRPQPNPTQARYTQPSNHATNGQNPVPYSHSAAVAAAARTHSQQTPSGLHLPPQSNNSLPAPSASFSRASMDPSLDSKPKYPSTSTPGASSQYQTNKTWTPQPAQPVAMGAARPTMTGINSGPGGVMGQPAIQKQPPFLLQGTGERVLDKKKLDELVRQVTGGSGEGLGAEVEESVLTLADEFIDNVITSACKLAKLRGSGSLEIRDLQLVLERQYNIRIPGYATDDVRTVKKTMPSAQYLQKMNAIGAAKIMGGKGDL